MVFYRKYRPQKIEELDNDRIRETLYSIFSRKSYPHAFLFTGPKGLGKTSAARIIAKVVNCETRQKNTGKTTDASVEPCNKCNQCVSITNGINIDILEIDGASNRGIDEIRDLKEKIKLSPASASKKVYIIDEVHMLTTEAFNALLKTLEEPPSHALFILCTTEPHKVPATISSRCFQMEFKKATTEELVRAFERISKLEKIKIDKEALEAIAKLSDGSFRDGVKLLEEINSLSKDAKITKETVEKKHKVSNITDQVLEMIESLAKKDTKSGLKLIGKIVENGGDLKYFVASVIEKLHSLMLAKVGVGQELEETSLSIDELRDLIQIFNRAYSEAKYSVLVQLPFEVAVIEWSQKESEEAEVVKEVLEIKKTVASDEKIKTETEKEPIQQPKLIEKNQAFWAEVIDKMKSHNHTIAGVLRGASLREMDQNKITIETGFKFHQEKLSETKTHRILEEVCSEIAGRKITVSILLKQK